jgi:hypothetical protein
LIPLPRGLGSFHYFGDDIDETTVYLVRVSQRDIRAGAERLKDAPGIHSVVVAKKGSVGNGPPDESPMK